MTNIGQEEHHTYFGAEIVLCLDIFHLILKGHWNQCLVQSGYPWVLYSLFSCITRVQVELCQSVEKVSCQTRQVVGKLKRLQGK